MVAGDAVTKVCRTLFMVRWSASEREPFNALLSAVLSN